MVQCSHKIFPSEKDLLSSLLSSRSYLWSKGTLAISYFKIVPTLLVGVILAHLQLELGESKLHHFPSWCCNRPLAIQFRLVVAIVVEIKTGDSAPAFCQVDETSTALFWSIGETSYSSEATRRDRAISSGQRLIRNLTPDSSLELKDKLSTTRFSDWGHSCLVATVFSLAEYCGSGGLPSSWVLLI